MENTDILADAATERVAALEARAVQLRHESEWNEQRWRYCATRYGEERDARLRMAHAARLAYESGVRIVAPRERAARYEQALRAIADMDASLPSGDDDLLKRLTQVLAAHGERLNHVAEFWSNRADQARAELASHYAEHDEKLDEIDTEYVEEIVNRYTHLTGSAMAAYAVGLELRGELERISMTVAALDRLAGREMDMTLPMPETAPEQEDRADGRPP